MNQGIINKLDGYCQYDVRYVWEDIVGGISIIVNEDPEWLTMRVEDVYGLCLSGQAQVWGYHDYEISDCFCIVQVQVCPYRPANKTLQLLIAWNNLEKQIAADFNEIATKLAKHSGCNGIEIWTSAEKLAAYAKGKGFTKTMYVLRRNLYQEPRYFKEEPEDTVVQPILGIVQSEKGHNE